MLHKTINYLVALFFPNRCICCDRLCTKPYLCKDCEDTVQPISQKTCFKCGLPLKHCFCDRNFYYFNGAVACFKNEGAARNMVYGYKFFGNRCAKDYFIDQMFKAVEKRYSHIAFDAVCFVPCHKSAKKEFGFDRVGIIAKGLAKKLKIKYCNALVQPKLTQKQHTVNGTHERFKTIRNKYKVKGNVNLADKTILLVDDIKTVGATLSECSRELKLAGAKEVYCVTVLATYPKDKD